MEYLLAFAAVTAPGAIGLSLGLLGLSDPLALLAAALVGGALGWAWCRRDRHQTRWIVASLASAVAPLLLVGFVVDAIHVVSRWYPTTTLRRLAPSGEWIAVADGVIKTELEGADRATDRQHNEGQLPSDHFAAPLVHAGWRRTDPVATWVLCKGDRDPCHALFRRRPLVGYVWRERRDGRVAIARAIARHRILAPRHVLVLEIHTESVLDAWAAIVACGLGLVVLNGVAARRTSAKRRVSRARTEGAADKA